MTHYTLNLQVDSAILQMSPTDSLCLARKVNNDYSAVFISAGLRPSAGQKALNGNNTFEWVDRFQVFLTQSFSDGILIQESTNSVDILPGQISHYKDGILGPAQSASTPSVWDTGDGAGPDSSFGVGGYPIAFHAAIKQQTGAGQYTAIYVDPGVHMSTSLIQLTPKNKFLLFWSSVPSGETMAAIQPSQGFEFEFQAGSPSVTVRFGYASPNSPSGPDENPGWYLQ
ncbi:hypothetical protein BGZ61DRAFT_430853 [Ilyonectria robusta]|uniref:uncharacterized protein n=1 Tax=Ilyonectria robusta TaxID=1079257 RepID=UPI001E8EC374|nr:uncharacterized protein BGZ61DRAFT_430853 [Ilyonectria robusta]KAH8665491.1 hypothetical protein BGZ61DRAFT_430853 [Ilyonectria robusta]